MSCRPTGTADVVPRRCSSCGELEHGSVACCVMMGDMKIEEFTPLITVGLPVTYRVMDDLLFVVLPGEPPR